LSISLGELAKRFDCELLGDPAIEVDRVATIGNATATSVTFLANPAYKKMLAATEAAAVILNKSASADCPVAALVSNNPYATYAKVATLLYPESAVAAGVHPSAVIASSATVSEDACVAAYAVIGENCSVAANAHIGPGCVVGDDCHIGVGSRLFANVTLVRRVTMGERCNIYPGAVIGSPGFGFARDADDGWVHVPQIGRVMLGNDVDIGSNTTIDCGAIEDTIIENGVKLDNQIQIGHNVHIGEQTVMAATVGIAGSTTIGKRCMFGGASGTVGHITICDDVIVNGLSMISKDITQAGVYAGAFPAAEVGRWRRYVARFRQVDRLAKRVANLEALQKKK
jgi:UDP-3-O-[3-hydroxymyristoyl] glucosamine N-acyltransferase